LLHPELIPLQSRLCDVATIDAVFIVGLGRILRRIGLSPGCRRQTIVCALKLGACQFRKVDVANRQADCSEGVENGSFLAGT